MLMTSKFSMTSSSDHQPVAHETNVACRTVQSSPRLEFLCREILTLRQMLMTPVIKQFFHKSSYDYISAYRCHCCFPVAILMQRLSKKKKKSDLVN